MVYSLVVVGDLQDWCGDHWGSVGGIEQQTMVGSTGKGAGSHGFGCGPGGGVVGVRIGCMWRGPVGGAGGAPTCGCWWCTAGVQDLLGGPHCPPPMRSARGVGGAVEDLPPLQAVGTPPVGLDDVHV